MKSRCNERERRLLSGVGAFPETWERVRDTLGHPDPGDPFLTKVWVAFGQAHDKGERPDLAAVYGQLEAHPRPLSEEDRDAWRKLAGGWSHFIDARSVTDEAERARRARMNEKVAPWFRDAAKVLEANPLIDAFELIEAARDDLQRSAYTRRLDVPIANVAEVTRRALEATNPATIPSGFGKLDSSVGGIPIGLLTLIGARSGRGKSIFLASLARNQIFVNARGPFDDPTKRVTPNEDPSRPYVLVVSCELTSEMFCERLACDMLDIHADDMRDRRTGAVDSDPYALMSAQDYYELLERHARFAVLGESDLGSMKITRVCSVIEAWADKVTATDPNATLLVMVDYLQRVDPTDEQSKAGRHREIELMAKSFATLAKRRQIAIVTAVQINDTPENGEPVRGDCRESKGANNEAGLIVVLHGWSGQQRAALTAALGADANQLRAMSMLCDKSRMGKDGWRAVLDIDGAHYRVSDAAPGTPNYLLDAETLQTANGGKKAKRPRSK